MLVCVMEVGVVRVRMPCGIMGMIVSMRLSGGVEMLVRMMFVMHVAVVVDDGLMKVFVLVGFSQVQVDPQGHQSASRQHGHGDRFAQNRDRRCGPDKRPNGEVCPGSGSPNPPQGQHEEDQADPISTEADQAA